MGNQQSGSRHHSGTLRRRSVASEPHTQHKTHPTSHDRSPPTTATTRRGGGGRSGSSAAVSLSRSHGRPNTSPSVSPVLHFPETASGATGLVTTTAAPPPPPPSGHLGSHAPSVSSLTTAAAAPNWQLASSSPEPQAWLRDNEVDEEGGLNVDRSAYSMSRAPSSMRMPNATFMSADEVPSGLASEEGAPSIPMISSAAVQPLFITTALPITTTTTTAAAAAVVVASTTGTRGGAGDGDELNAGSSVSSLGTNTAGSPLQPPPAPTSYGHAQSSLSSHAAAAAEEVPLPLIVRSSRQASISAARVTAAGQREKIARPHSPSPEACPPSQSKSNSSHGRKSASKRSKARKDEPSAAATDELESTPVAASPLPKHSMGMMGALLNSRSSRFLFRKSASSTAAAAAQTREAKRIAAKDTTPSSQGRHRSHDDDGNDINNNDSGSTNALATNAARHKPDTEVEASLAVKPCAAAADGAGNASAVAVAQHDDHGSRGDDDDAASATISEIPCSTALPIDTIATATQANLATHTVPPLPPFSPKLIAQEGGSAFTTAAPTHAVSLYAGTADMTKSTGNTRAQGSVGGGGTSGRAVTSQLQLPAKEDAVSSGCDSPLTVTRAGEVPCALVHDDEGNRHHDKAKAAVSVQHANDTGVDEGKEEVLTEHSPSERVIENTDATPSPPPDHTQNTNADSPTVPSAATGVFSDKDKMQDEVAAAPQVAAALPIRAVQSKLNASSPQGANVGADSEGHKEDGPSDDDKSSDDDGLRSCSEGSHSTTSTDTNSAPILPPPPTASFAEAMWGAKPTALGAVNSHPQRHSSRDTDGNAGDGGGGVALSTSGSSTGPSSSLIYSPRAFLSRSGCGGGGGALSGATTVTDTTARISPPSPYTSPPPPATTATATITGDGRSLLHPVTAVASTPANTATAGDARTRGRRTVSQSAIIAAWNRMGARSSVLAASTVVAAGKASAPNNSSNNNGSSGSPEESTTAAAHAGVTTVSSPSGPSSDLVSAVAAIAASSKRMEGMHHKDEAVQTAAKTSELTDATMMAAARSSSVHAERHAPVLPVRRRSVLTRQRGNPSLFPPPPPPSLSSSRSEDDNAVGSAGEATPQSCPDVVTATTTAAAADVPAEALLPFNEADPILCSPRKADVQPTAAQLVEGGLSSFDSDGKASGSVDAPASYATTYALPKFYTHDGVPAGDSATSAAAKASCAQFMANHARDDSKAVGSGDSDKSGHPTSDVPLSRALTIPSVRVENEAVTTTTASGTHSRVLSGVGDAAEGSEVNTSATIRIQHTTDGDADDAEEAEHRPRNPHGEMDSALLPHTIPTDSELSSELPSRRLSSVGGALTTTHTTLAASVTVATLKPHSLQTRRSLSDTSPLTDAAARSLRQRRCDPLLRQEVQPHVDKIHTSCDLVWGTPSSLPSPLETVEALCSPRYRCAAQKTLELHDEERRGSAPARGAEAGAIGGSNRRHRHQHHHHYHPQRGEGGELREGDREDAHSSDSDSSSCIDADAGVAAAAAAAARALVTASSPLCLVERRKQQQAATVVASSANQEASSSGDGGGAGNNSTSYLHHRLASPPTVLGPSRSGSIGSSSPLVVAAGGVRGGAAQLAHTHPRQREQQQQQQAPSSVSSTSRLIPYWRERTTPQQALSPRPFSPTRDDAGYANTTIHHASHRVYQGAAGGDESSDSWSPAGSRRRRLSTASQGPPPLAQRPTSPPPPLNRELSGSGVQWREVSLLTSAVGTPSVGVIRPDSREGEEDDQYGDDDDDYIEAEEGENVFGTAARPSAMQRRWEDGHRHHRRPLPYHSALRVRDDDVYRSWSSAQSPVLWGVESPRSWRRTDDNKGHNVDKDDEDDGEGEEEETRFYDDERAYGAPSHRAAAVVSRDPHLLHNRSDGRDDVAGRGGRASCGGHGRRRTFSPCESSRLYRVSPPLESSLPCTPPEEQSRQEDDDDDVHPRRRFRDLGSTYDLDGGSAGGATTFLASSTSDHDLPHTRTATTSFADNVTRLPLTQYEPPMPSNRNTFTAFVPLADISSSHLLASAAAIFQGGYQRDDGVERSYGRPSLGPATNGSGEATTTTTTTTVTTGHGFSTADTPVTADTLLVASYGSPGGLHKLMSGRSGRSGGGGAAAAAAAETVGRNQLNSPLFSSVSTAPTNRISQGCSPMQGSLSLLGGALTTAATYHHGGAVGGGRPQQHPAGSFLRACDGDENPVTLRQTPRGLHADHEASRAAASLLLPLKRKGVLTSAAGAATTAKGAPPHSLLLAAPAVLLHGGPPTETKATTVLLPTQPQSPSSVESAPANTTETVARVGVAGSFSPAADSAVPHPCSLLLTPAVTAKDNGNVSARGDAAPLATPAVTATMTGTATSAADRNCKGSSGLQSSNDGTELGGGGYAGGGGAAAGSTLFIERQHPTPSLGSDADIRRPTSAKALRSSPPLRVAASPSAVVRTNSEPLITCQPHRCSDSSAALCRTSQELPWWNRARLARSEGSGLRAEQQLMSSFVEKVSRAADTADSSGAVASPRSASSSSPGRQTTGVQQEPEAGDGYAGGGVAARGTAVEPRYTITPSDESDAFLRMQDGSKDDDGDHHNSFDNSNDREEEEDLRLHSGSAERKTAHDADNILGRTESPEEPGRRRRVAEAKVDDDAEPVCIKLVRSFEVDGEAEHGHDYDDEDNATVEKKRGSHHASVDGDMWHRCSPVSFSSVSHGGRVVQACATAVIATTTAGGGGNDKGEEVVGRRRTSPPTKATVAAKSNAPAVLTVVVPATTSFLAESSVEANDTDSSCRDDAARNAVEVSETVEGGDSAELRSRSGSSRSVGAAAAATAATLTFGARLNALMDAETYTRACIDESAVDVVETWKAVWVTLQHAASMTSTNPLSGTLAPLQSIGAEGATAKEEEKEGEDITNGQFVTSTSSPSPSDLMTQLASAPHSPTGTGPTLLSVVAMATSKAGAPTTTATPTTTKVSAAITAKNEAVDGTTATTTVGATSPGDAEGGSDGDAAAATTTMAFSTSAPLGEEEPLSLRSEAELRQQRGSHRCLMSPPDALTTAADNDDNNDDCDAADPAHIAAGGSNAVMAAAEAAGPSPPHAEDDISGSSSAAVTVITLNAPRPSVAVVKHGISSYVLFGPSTTTGYTANSTTASMHAAVGKEKVVLVAEGEAGYACGTPHDTSARATREDAAAVFQAVSTPPPSSPRHRCDDAPPVPEGSTTAQGRRPALPPPPSPTLPSSPTSARSIVSDTVLPPTPDASFHTRSGSPEPHPPSLLPRVLTTAFSTVKSCRRPVAADAADPLSPPPRLEVEEEKRRAAAEQVVYRTSDISVDRAPKASASPSPQTLQLRASSMSSPALWSPSRHLRSVQRRPSIGQVVCRWCGELYTSAVVCPVVRRIHQLLREERKKEKQAKRRAQALLCEGRVAEAVAVLKEVGVYVP